MRSSEFTKNTLISLLICYISVPAGAQITGFNNIKWSKEKIAPGLVWKSSHTVLNDTIPQNINLLVVNLRKRSLSIQYDHTKNRTTSSQAESAGALAAVNAGFFNIKDGGSVTYIRSNGLIAETDTAGKWKRNSNMTGSLLIDDDREVFIKESMPNSWYDSNPDYEDVLITGPLLMKGSQPVRLPETSLVISRHPRSAAGTISSNKVLLLTIDGRTGESYGMTLPELAELMRLLGCKDAINLDGGGSTTMWINGKPFNGVVNMPCDNKLFDHLGERAVSDILIVK